MEHNEWLNCYWPLERLEKDQVPSCFPFQPVVLLPGSSVGPNIQSIPKGTFWLLILVIYLGNFPFLLGALSPFSSKEASCRNTHLMGEDSRQRLISSLLWWHQSSGDEKEAQLHQYMEISPCRSAQLPRDGREDWAPACRLSDANLSKC